jgi:hypothetical protein
MLPATVSAAIEAGTRPQGTNCDIGAVEVQADVIFADGFEQE